MKLRKKLSCLLALTLAVPAGNQMTLISAKADDEIITIQDEITEDGMIISTGDESLVSEGTEETILSEEEASLVGAGNLPSSYKPSAVTDIIDQGSSYLCWAYSTLDAGQIDQLQNGLTSRTDLIYSAGHLAYSAYNGEGDHFKTRRNWYRSGGNYAVAGATLLSWYGAASESSYPTSESLSLTEDQKSESLSHLVSYERLKYLFAHNGTLEGGNPLSQEWKDGIIAVKEEVLENGAVTIDYAATGSDDLPEVNNSNGAVVYHSNKTGQTHQGVIVGWDDTKETGASLPGAYYIKNTWGVTSGENGYRWLSYYDMSITNAIVYHFEDHVDGNHDYDTLYSYDSTGYYRVIKNSKPRKGANVFTADRSTNVGAVGIYAPINSRYTVQIETGLKDGIPGTGTIVSEASGTADYLGFYTVDVPDVQIKKGESFAVIATIQGIDDGYYYIFAEGYNDYAGELFRLTTAEAGQSYVHGVDGDYTWQDSYDTHKNVCIKAYGNEIQEKSIEIYRLYNKKSGEHLYTSKSRERDYLSSLSTWDYEGIGWYAPESSGKPVYRLYNTKSGEHLYTADNNERQVLSTMYSWKDEGIVWYSDEKQGVPIYRIYNPRASVFAHHYTADQNEYRVLVSLGWKDEKIGWYGVAVS